ncbi:MAG: nicotinate-nucleotide adenylyltransferase [Lachnospiraceae bacterium]|nr:nicotinate-nucleotide adenylyltransferase [Lachnospiraceae bacterium]
MGRIGIMGGTFNPIHIGHLMLAECAREELDLAEVWFIPTGVSYMKAGKSGAQPEGAIPSSEERLEMTRLAVQDNPCFRCLDLEVKRAGATYTYETLDELGQLYPQHTFYFICGADCLETIENWRCPERIFADCTLVAAVRGEALLSEMEDKKRELVEKYGAEIVLLPFRNLELSSTDIRKRVKNAKSIRYMVTDAVYRYIEEKRFYKND